FGGIGGGGLLDVGFEPVASKHQAINRPRRGPRLEHLPVPPLVTNPGVLLPFFFFPRGLGFSRAGRPVSRVRGGPQAHTPAAPHRPDGARRARRSILAASGAPCPSSVQGSGGCSRPQLPR